jgi:hypothetical protein
MRTTLTSLVAVLGLAFPAAALAHGQPSDSHGAGHGHAAHSHGQAAHSHGQAGTHGQGRAHRHVPTVAVVAHGTVVSVDTTNNTAIVQITRANHHGAGLVGTQVTVDLSNARITVADVNADGQKNLADVAANDEVVVQGRVPLHGSLTGSLVARHLIDQTHAPTSDPATSTQTTSDS